jgi:hypothetical protein
MSRSIRSWLRSASARTMKRDEYTTYESNERTQPQNFLLDLNRKFWVVLTAQMLDHLQDTADAAGLLHRVPYRGPWHAYVDRMG